MVCDHLGTPLELYDARGSKNMAGAALTRSSLFGGMELYSYVSNPTSWVDIFGLDPYHGPKPTYENPGHHQPRHPNLRGGETEKTSILPKNAEDIYKNAIPDAEGKHWYARSENGEIHRFGNSNNGKAHWNGSSNQGRGVVIPKEV